MLKREQAQLKSTLNLLPSNVLIGSFRIQQVKPKNRYATVQNLSKFKSQFQNKSFNTFSSEFSEDLDEIFTAKILQNLKQSRHDTESHFSL